jgi:hypothetical protein
MPAGFYSFSVAGYLLIKIQFKGVQNEYLCGQSGF